MPIYEQLDLTARVAAAEHLVPLWDLHHPARPHLTTSDEIADALRAGSPHDNDRLLLRLAELAHVDGGGSLDAAAVLAKLVLPGVGAGCGDVLLSGRGPRWISTLQRCYGSPAGRSRTGRPNGWRRRRGGDRSRRRYATNQALRDRLADLVVRRLPSGLHVRGERVRAGGFRRIDLDRALPGRRIQDTVAIALAQTRPVRNPD